MFEFQAFVEMYLVGNALRVCYTHSEVRENKNDKN